MTDLKCSLHDEVFRTLRGDISEVCRRLQKIEETHEKLIEQNRQRIENVKDAQQSNFTKLYITIIILSLFAGANAVIEGFKLLKSIL